jgi:hypothetical protein
VFNWIGPNRHGFFYSKWESVANKISVAEPEPQEVASFYLLEQEPIYIFWNVAQGKL